MALFAIMTFDAEPLGVPKGDPVRRHAWLRAIYTERMRS